MDDVQAFVDRNNLQSEYDTAITLAYKSFGIEATIDPEYRLESFAFSHLDYGILETVNFVISLPEVDPTNIDEYTLHLALAEKTHNDLKDAVGYTAHQFTYSINFFCEPAR